MKISNEAKVGLLAIAAILVLVFGFNFLKGKNIFNRTPAIYAVFENIGSLEKSNTVKINGLPVGTVYNFFPSDKEVNRVIVEIHLNRDIAIPRNSIAFIDGALVGSSYINIEKGSANTYLQPGDTISTRLDQGLMADLKTQLSPTITRVNQTLDSLRLAIGSINAIFDPSTNNNLQMMISRLSVASGHLQTLLDAQTGALSRSLHNLNSVTGNLASNNEAITSSIRNVERTTASLANARIEQTIAALEGTINELQGTTAELKTSISRINSKDGTLGLLMNDRQLYDQISKTALGLEILLDDVRIHPKRYVNISVFGGRNKGEPLTSPAVKDTISSTD